MKIAFRAVPSGWAFACAVTFSGKLTPAIVPANAMLAHFSTSRRATKLSVFHSIGTSVLMLSLIIQQKFRRVQQRPQNVCGTLASVRFQYALRHFHFFCCG